MCETSSYKHALIVGASGGLGSKFLEACRAPGIADRVTAWSRQPLGFAISGVSQHVVDVRDEPSIVTAANAIDDLDLVIIATGLLHATARADGGPEVRPEKTWRTLTSDAMAEVFAVNAIGPALVAKHVLPKFPRDRRAVCVTLSARVGSIGDNKLGGWMSYRASKAALNQIIRTLSIELATKCPQAICVGLHPGTVDTRLSKPFQSAVPTDALIDPQVAAGLLMKVIGRLTIADTGGVFDWAGLRIPD